MENYIVTVFETQSAQTIVSVLTEIVIFYNDVAIYLVFGFLVAAVLHVLFPDSIVKKHLGKDSLGSVFKSSLFGIPIPLCSCGVVPVATSLKNSGASKGATISFLISTPQVGADSFMITYSLLGWFFGIYRIIASFVTAITAGIFVNIFGQDRQAKQFPMAPASVDKGTALERLKAIVPYVEYSLLGSIANSLVVGLIIAGLISSLIPDGFFELYLSSNLLSMLLMLVVGIPMYICASASTPIAASLIMKGMSPGAALVFLLAGPATNAMGIAAILKVVGKKATAIYLGVIAISSVILGYLLNLIAEFFGISNVIMFHQHDILPMWLKLSGSVILGIMLLWYYGDTKLFSRLKKGETTMSNKIIIPVDGMSCMHCSGSVEKAVASVEGTSDIVVSLNDKNVHFQLEDSALIDKVKAAVIQAGFTVGKVSL